MDVVWGVFAGALIICIVWITITINNIGNRLNTLLININEKLTAIEGEIRPILRDVEQTLKNVEPLTRELGEHGDDIGRLLGNIEQVSDDAQATTGAVRNGIVPIAQTLQALFAGVMEGAKALGDYRSRADDDDDNY